MPTSNRKPSPWSLLLDMLAGGSQKTGIPEIRSNKKGDPASKSELAKDIVQFGLARSAGYNFALFYMIMAVLIGTIIIVTFAITWYPYFF